MANGRKGRKMKEIEREFMDIFISKDLFNGLMKDFLCDENDVVNEL